jgi:hypothetical protein
VLTGILTVLTGLAAVVAIFTFVMRYRARGTKEAEDLANTARIGFHDAINTGGRVTTRHLATPEYQQLDRDLEALPDKVGRTRQPLSDDLFATIGRSLPTQDQGRLG